MTEIALFHHVQGLTEGVETFADELREAGHTVHTPDLFEGKTFDTIDEGLEFVHALGVMTVVERGAKAVEELPSALVYGGFSLGVMPAQFLAQTRPGALGALLFHACIPPEEFGSWPNGLRAQVHGMEGDPFFAGEGDIDAARTLVASEPTVELFVYPGDEHLFTDSSLTAYDEVSADLVMDRTLAFLATVAA